MGSLSREQLEQLVVNTMELVTQIILLLFPPSTKVEAYEHRASEIQNGSMDLLQHDPAVMGPELLRAKRFAAVFQSMTARWVCSTVERYMPKPQNGFVAYVYTKLLFGVEIDGYFGAKVIERE